jgi:phosphoribosylanthranilate isomerase
VLVKICGIATEEDALLAVALGADALGFIFAPSPRQVRPQSVERIIHRLPPEILTVGVFRDEAAKRVVQVTNGIGLKAAQLHGSESIADTRYVVERVPLTIKAFPAGHPDIARSEEFGAQSVLVDGKSPGSGEVFEWRLVEGVVDPSRLIVSGGLNAGNVQDAIRHLCPLGVDVSSGVESEPGRKDPRKLREFITSARAAAPEQEEVGEGDLGQSGISTEEPDAPYDWGSD